MANDVLEKLEPHERPPRKEQIYLRWILHYRLGEDEKKSPPASPTVTTNTRQLLLQFGSWMGLSAAKGDVSGAFLQGRKLQRDLWVPPVPELAAARNVAPAEIMRLKKADCVQ